VEQKVGQKSEVIGPAKITLPKETDMTTSYVLYIEFDDDLPRVGVFDTFEEGEAQLDAL
jgi:hypothetical protein